jgi:hypothetical protein
MFDNVGTDNIEIELVEDYPCNSLLELNIREQYWIDKIKPKYNSKRAHRTHEQELQCKRDEYQRNKHVYKDYVQQKLENETPEQRKDRLEKARLNYLKHREEIRERQKRKFECDCGRILTWGSRHGHWKSDYHIKTMKQREESGEVIIIQPSDLDSVI